ncbi:MAG: substrate-binding domain-containing protein, partial [Methylomonas sp.]|nr:substrate-binding domain-containing protein [Methylomonas sp.]
MKWPIPRLKCRSLAPYSLGRPVVLAALVCLLLVEIVSAEDKALSLDEMRRAVADASNRASRWGGPESGPIGKQGMRVAVVCEDLRNGGVLGVARGIAEAAAEIGWKFQVFDARGHHEGRRQELTNALATNPDGMILVGSDAASLEPDLAAYVKRSIPIVGWHVGPTAGRLSGGAVAMNVSTDPLEVARVTAMAAIVDSHASGGMIIVNDSNFEIATAKANAMAEIIRQCRDCVLLEVRDLPISQSAHLMPEITKEWLAYYGKRWTHTLAINDIFFDYMAPELTKAGRDISLFSAGDGSSAAFLRIQAGIFQRGTVAEPLNLQGWQLVDELNRLLSRHPVSAYVMPAHLVTPEIIGLDG